MVARVASFDGLNVEAARRTNGEGEAIIRPLISTLEGFQSSLDLLSADGKVPSITIFGSEANALAAEATFDEQIPQLPGDLFEDWVGHRVSVDHYEVLARTDT